MEYPGLDTQADWIQPIINQLQANILKSHGRDYSAFVFVKIDKDITGRLKRFLSTLPITSSKDQIIQTEEYRKSGTSENTVITVGLSITGYKKLGFTNYNETPRNLSYQKGPQTFIKSMSGPGIELSQIALGEWDLLIHLSDDSAQKVKTKLEHVIGGIPDSCKVKVENGFVLRNDEGSVVEAFGFADGISNPKFLKSELSHKDEANNNYDPSGNPFHLLLDKDPANPEFYGSYLTLLKIEQNKDRYIAQIKKTCSTLADKGIYIDMEKVEEQLVGRKKNGTPLVNSPNNKNNFNYSADPDGVKCPFFSHVRKMNPREPGKTRFHRLARRGVSYSNETECGLLFLGFQQNINRQFEFLFKSWAFSSDFPVERSGVDPILNSLPFKKGVQFWDRKTPLVSTTVEDVIRIHQIDYFFFPSIKFIKALADA